jgi:hypothetical protein
MFKRRNGVTFVIKNGQKNEIFCLYDKPFMGKSNGIYADIGNSKDEVINFIKDIEDCLIGTITNFTCNEGHFKREEIPEGKDYSKGSPFTVEFNYKEISGLSANIYVPSVSKDKILEIAKILKKLTWKVGETPLEIKVIKYKQTF